MSANDPKPFLPSKEEVTLFGSGLLVCDPFTSIPHVLADSDVTNELDSRR